MLFKINYLAFVLALSLQGLFVIQKPTSFLLQINFLVFAKVPYAPAFLTYYLLVKNQV